ncbi:MAG: metallophosphoesterase [Pseudomonadota bacterium]
MKQVCLAAVSDPHLDQDKNRLRDILWSCEEYVESGVDHLILTGDFVSRTPLRRGFTKKGCRELFAKIKQDMKEYGLYKSSIVPATSLHCYGSKTKSYMFVFWLLDMSIVRSDKAIA